MLSIPRTRTATVGIMSFTRSGQAHTDRTDRTDLAVSSGTAYLDKQRRTFIATTTRRVKGRSRTISSMIANRMTRMTTATSLTTMTETDAMADATA